jgi:predicted nucleic acid-binding protein
LGVQILALQGAELELFLGTVGAPAADALGDGEAAAIAMAVSRELDLVIDDRKARRILRQRFSQVRVYWTVELLRARRVLLRSAVTALTTVSQRQSGSGACMCRAIDVGSDRRF